ncbi:MAG: nucleoside recognition domain-containing protein [Clostridia bacterium]
MKYIENLSATFKSNKFLWFRYIPLSFVVFFIGFSLLKFPAASAQGVINGLQLCFTTLIPSLFPFLILCSFFVNSGLCERTGRYFTKFTKVVFKQPGVSANVIFLSLVGGYPVGAKLISQLYEQKQISQIQAQRLMLFCVNAGPAFVISSVGYFMLGSKEVGVIIFVSLCLASLILGVLSRFFLEDSEAVYEKKSVISYDQTISESLVNAVSQSIASMASICAWVVLFSCLNALVNVYGISVEFSQFLSSVLEVTTGCLIASEFMPIAAVAGIIAFGGFCVHFQIMSCIVKVKLKYKYFITARIISTGLSMVICQYLLQFCSVETDVFSTGSTPSSTIISISIPVTIGLIMMCILLLLGDNYRLGKLKKS